MNGMRKYSTSGILISVLLIFSIFTLLSFSGVNAEEIISVNAESYENTIIIEFKNESASKIKTIRMWAGGDTTFKSFKTEPGWGGGKQSDDRLLIFVATNTLNPGESVKFGLIVDEKVDGMNWIALDQNAKEIDTRKASIQEISKSTSSYAEEESKSVDEIKETGGSLYGTKTFIPETIRVDSDVRLVGSGFGSQKNLQLYLDNTIIKSVKTDQNGNFLTTITIPKTHNVGTSEFLIKDDFGDFQITNINIGESKNRFLKSTMFKINSIPTQIAYDETLTISGHADPQSAIIFEFENMEKVLEKTRVITADSAGEWVFEEIVSRSDSLGQKYLILKNNSDRKVTTLDIQSGDVIEISTTAKRYNLGETVSITGTSEPNKNTTIWIKDENKKTVIYDIISSNGNGDLVYEFVANDAFPTGTYSVTVKQESESDATFFGINQDPSKGVITLMEKTNYMLNSKAILSVVGPESTNITISILNNADEVQTTDTITTSNYGKGQYVIDLAGFGQGVFRAVAVYQNIQDSVKFSVGIETGAGEISLSTTKESYHPGDSILIIGQTGFNARLTISLHDPSENIVTKTNIFSDSTGGFSTNDIGIPSSGMIGDWKIIAYSPGSVLQFTEIVHVVSPSENG